GGAQGGAHQFRPRRQGPGRAPRDGRLVSHEWRGPGRGSRWTRRRWQCAWRRADTYDAERAPGGQERRSQAGEGRDERALRCVVRQARSGEDGHRPAGAVRDGVEVRHDVADQPIVVKIDDPKSPLTTMYKGQPFDFRGEIYTFGMDTWSRENLHVLSSIDYSMMSDADKAKENFPRSDHDYGMSWIKRDGNGRVFYLAFGNEEKTFFIKPINEQLLAGIQYALGDLKADDSPSVKPGTR
ncbi:MAG: ThuA domain-containing protein, partial [Acidobacteria bacterium]|nr:ThuA domain-containing protein [Acidobacteriota bacterium]